MKYCHMSSCNIVSLSIFRSNKNLVDISVNYSMQDVTKEMHDLLFNDLINFNLFVLNHPIFKRKCRS